MRVARALPVALVLLFGAVALPSRSDAQHDMGAMIGMGDNTITLTDPPKDVQISAASRAGAPGENASMVGSDFDDLDVVKIVFGDESEASFAVTLTFTTLQSGSVPGTPQRAVFFFLGKEAWRASVGACQSQRPQPGASTPAPTQGCLAYRDGSGRGGGYRNYKPVDLEVLGDQHAYRFTIPKAVLFNENHTVAHFGDVLTNIYASAVQPIGTAQFLPGGDPTGGASAFDLAPNTGTYTDHFTLIKGSHGHGHFALSADQPIRVSNGEATTIVYKVVLFNHATAPLTAQLDTKNLRPEWTVRVPSIVKLEPTSNVTIPVVLAMPFTHEHGARATFTVTAQAVEDAASQADLDLGVWWTDVPQPSAHHNGELWFHAAPGSSNLPGPAAGTFTPEQGWVNAIETDPDPDADDANIPAAQNQGFSCLATGGGTGCGVPPQSKVSWFFPLSPGLLIGLDFNIEKQAHVIADVIPQVPASQAAMTAKILYCAPGAARSQNGGGGGGGGGGTPTGNGTCGNYNVVLAVGTVESTLAANTEAHFEIPLQVQAAADYLPYKEGANIGVQIDLVTSTPQTVFGNGQPQVQFVTKKGHVYMPLVEYHDPVDASFEKLGALQLVPLSGFEKSVNPGRTAVYQFNLTNRADGPQTVDLDVQGINVDWASLKTPQRVVLASNGTTKVTLAVSPPPDAQDTERAELFVTAQNKDDASIVAVSRLRATVMVGEDIPDESAQIVTAKAKSPGLEGLATLLGAGVALAALDRRRRS